MVGKKSNASLFFYVYTYSVILWKILDFWGVVFEKLIITKFIVFAKLSQYMKLTIYSSRKSLNWEIQSVKAIRHESNWRKVKIRFFFLHTEIIFFCESTSFFSWSWKTLGVQISTNWKLKSSLKRFKTYWYYKFDTNMNIYSNNKQNKQQLIAPCICCHHIIILICTYTQYLP